MRILPVTSFVELEAGIERAMLADRFRLRRRLDSIRRAHRKRKPFDRNLKRLEDDLARSVAAREARARAVPPVRLDDSLPIAARAREIADALDRHQVIVVAGETGSGKSTQLPKICLQAGRGVAGLIGHTQPRRIAARSVAARVAEELGCELGRQVGFKIRFTDATQPGTYLKLMTDGILLAESQHDRFLEQYDTIIIDEAHERSLNIDFLLGYLKRLLARRDELKVIITSATIDAERFSRHFASDAGPAPVISVSGRTYPVEVRYRPLEADDEGNEPDLLDAVAVAVDEAASLGEGDVLVFMPTERHIHETAKRLRGRTLPGDRGRTTEILPLYARLSATDQNRVFQPHPHRRVVIATNVAESSLTVPGIRYVVDTGTARISRYSPRSRLQRLPIEAVSQASADQRKGRCGRIGPGVCLRLYTQEDYEGRDRYTVPEIQRTNLAAVILQTLALGLGRLDEFPFLDPPKPEAVRDGYRTLFEIGALDESEQLTPLGRQLSRFPVDPRIGRMVLAAHEENCLHEVLVIAAALEVQDPRERPLDKQQAADESHARFADEDSDFIGWLKLWDFYHKLKDDLSRNRLRKACQQSFLNYNRLREWADVHRQLREVAERAGLRQGPRRDDYDAIHRALLTGLLSGIALRDQHQNEYRVAGGGKANLWPGAGPFAKKPRWIVSAELVETNRKYLRTVAHINPGWIEPLAKHLLKRTYSEPQWDPQAVSAVAFEQVTLFGLIVVPRRSVRYGRIDPAVSRELFIRHALVQGTLETSAPFFAHNRDLLEELNAAQAKSRKTSLLPSEDAQYEFYAARIPADVCDGARFEKWRRQAERESPRLLFMQPSDLLQDAAAAAETASFPDALAVAQMKLPLEYRFEPGDDRDGMTLTVPQQAMNQLDPRRLEWLVPGMLEEKVVALIKSLRKAQRRQFVPAAETARALLERLEFAQGDLKQAVASALSELEQGPVQASDFQDEKLPENLRMIVRVVDDQGGELAAGRDLAQLQQQFAAQATASFVGATDAKWRRDGLTRWDFELPRQVEVERNGVTLIGHPALIDRGDSVALRLLDSSASAAYQTRLGVRRLFVLAETRELRAQVNWLPRLDQTLLLAASLPDAGDLRAHLAELVAERAFFNGQALPQTAAHYEQQAAAARGRLGRAAGDVAELIRPLMESYHEARLLLEGAQHPNWEATARDVERQLAALTPRGFLCRTAWQWLQHYPRYFRAIALRLKKLAAGGGERDRRNIAEFAPRWNAFLQRAQSHQEQGLYDPELIAYRWILEEYRVSLFAQELGTALPVSAKRLDKQWGRIRG